MTDEQLRSKRAVDEAKLRGISSLGRQVCPCGTCGSPTERVDVKICGLCLEVESRLRNYLEVGGGEAVRFVSAELDRIGFWVERAR